VKQEAAAETSKPNAQQPNLVVVNDPESAVAEAYRGLRATLKYTRAEPRVQTMLLVDTGSGEHGAQASANLAASIALGGDTTTLVDANPRSPTQHALLNTPLSPGLVEWLEAGDLMPVRPHQTAIEHLSVVPAGGTGGTPPRSTADLVAGDAAIRLLSELRAGARFVLVHCAPMPAASDALGLAPHVDAVLLVVRAGTTKRTHAQQAREALDRVGARVLGVVLTDAR
jgi:capsular exopolysaccharide synthesis family protein